MAIFIIYLQLGISPCGILALAAICGEASSAALGCSRPLARPRELTLDLVTLSECLRRERSLYKAPPALGAFKSMLHVALHSFGSYLLQHLVPHHSHVVLRAMD